MKLKTELFGVMSNDFLIIIILKIYNVPKYLGKKANKLIKNNLSISFKTVLKLKYILLTRQETKLLFIKFFIFL